MCAGCVRGERGGGGGMMGSGGGGGLVVSNDVAGSGTTRIQPHS